ncbi:hypothetical protein [Leucobacter iarius]|uniref:CHAP domain-containing protein n=1 Tax=Leucobacter iarius TaxID=333963 RepID=A0ABP4XEA5_9MICO
MALLTVDQWANSVNGKYIDHDGIPAGNIYQCHDLWIDYLMRVAGGTQSMGYAPSGFTDSVFTNFPVNGLDAKVTRTSGTSGIRKGDVIFWGYGAANYPYSHVAIALAAPSGGSVLCMSQNPGASQKLTLTLAGALGYLRPKNLPTDPTPQPDPKEITVKSYHRENRTTRPIAPGQRLYLIDSGNAKENCVGGNGPYSLTAHLYGNGFAPGDVLEFRFESVTVATGAQSDHYLERVSADVNGGIRASREFKLDVPVGTRVHFSVYAATTNAKTGSMIVIDSDAYLFSVA